MGAGNQGLAQVGGAIVGAYVGGYQGMMMGMSLANAFYGPTDAYSNPFYNDVHKDTQVINACDVVAMTLGTDMAPGAYVWLNTEQTGMKEIFYYQNYEFWSILRKVLYVQDVEVFHTEWIASFTEYGRQDKINQVWMDKIHHWCWTRWDDYLHERHSWLNFAGTHPDEYWMENPGDAWYGVQELRIGNAYQALEDTRINPAQDISYQTSYEDDWTPNYSGSNFSWIRWWGMLYTPKANNVTILATNALDDFECSEEEDFRRMNLVGTPAYKFPDLRAEISGVNTPYSPFCGTTNYRWGDYDHSFRDNKSHYVYGIFEGDTSAYPELDNIECDIRRLDTHKWQYTRLIDQLVSYNTITKGYNYSYNGNSLSRQDIDDNPDHLYIMQMRNWYYAQKYHHHHAPYSMKYDIFYIDRSDDTVHSICYDQQVQLEGDDYSRFSESNPCPMFRPCSMEIAGDTILLFGYEWQSHSIWDDEFEIEGFEKNVATNTTRIYADFSRYPENYWVRNNLEYTGILPTGGWVYSGSNGNTGRIRYQTTKQTSTYVEVDGIWPFDFEEGDLLYVTLRRDIMQTSWTIVGEGSTNTEVVCPQKIPFNPRLFAGMQYDSIQFANEMTSPGTAWGFEIFSMDTTSTIIVGTFPRVPEAGEIVYFTWENHNLSEDYAYNPYYNPYNFRFLPNLWPYFEKYGLWNPLTLGDWTPGDLSWTGTYVGYDANYYFHTGLQNRQYWGRYTILKFSKSTGEYLGRLATYRTYGYTYTGRQSICVIEASSVSTVATDSQIAVAFKNVSPYTYTRTHNLIIDKSTLSIIDDRDSYHHNGNLDLLFGWSHQNYSHAANKDFRGAIKINTFDPETQTYSERWYGLINEFTPNNSIYITGYSTDTTSNLGTYIVDLGTQGIFPDLYSWLSMDSGIYSSLITADAALEGQIKWFRGDVATGPLYSYYFLHQNSIRDSSFFRFYDYDEKIHFMHSHSAEYYINELWFFQKPNESNRFGYSWPLSGFRKEWTLEAGTVYTPDSDDVYMSNKYGLSLGSDNAVLSNYCDLKINDALHYQRFVEFNPYMTQEDQDYCNDLVTGKIVMDGVEHDYQEPRYLYSRTFSTRTPLRDIVRDIMSVCQGIITECGYYTYYPNVKIFKPNEEAEWYFGLDEQTFTTTQMSPNYETIYINLSDYPENYWVGDAGRITHNNGTIEEFYVKEQYNTYIVLDSNLSEAALADEHVYLIKDNMIESSFTYAKKPQFDRSNQLKVEFMNRYMTYAFDIAQADDHYRQDILDERVINRQIELHGIKRPTHAARMALRYMDYESFINWMCSFQCDLIGHYVCPGDVIGVTHPVTGWMAKKFRIISIDILEDNQCKIETEEYLGGIYHDASTTPWVSSGDYSGSILSSYEYPEGVRRLFAFYDPSSNRIFVSYYYPSNQSNFYGINVYVSVDGGDEHFMGFAGVANASVLYSSTGTSETSVMESTRVKYNEMHEQEYQYTEIPYEPYTVLGSFPASGYLWVHGELISYNGIDTINNKFINCVRSINTPEYQYAVDALGDGYNWTNPVLHLADYVNLFSFEVPDDWVDLTTEATQTEGSEIAYHIPTVTIRAESIGVNGLFSNYRNCPKYNLQLRYPMGRPYSPSMLEYSRA